MSFKEMVSLKLRHRGFVMEGEARAKGVETVRAFGQPRHCAQKGAAAQEKGSGVHQLWCTTCWMWHRPNGSSTATSLAPKGPAGHRAMPTRG